MAVLHGPALPITPRPLSALGLQPVTTGKDAIYQPHLVRCWCISSHLASRFHRRFPDSNSQHCLASGTARLPESMTVHSDEDDTRRQAAMTNRNPNSRCMDREWRSVGEGAARSATWLVLMSAGTPLGFWGAGFLGSRVDFFFKVVSSGGGLLLANANFFPQ